MEQPESADRIGPAKQWLQGVDTNQVAWDQQAPDRHKLRVQIAQAEALISIARSLQSLSVGEVQPSAEPIIRTTKDADGYTTFETKLGAVSD